MSHFTRPRVNFSKLSLGPMYYHRIGRKLQSKWVLTLAAIITVVYFMTAWTNQGGVSISNVEASITGNFSSLIVNTPTCKIPELNIWDESLKLVKLKCHKEDEEDPGCKRKFPRDWMYSNATTLFVNESAMVESGFSWRSLHCCYRVITRVEQSLENYDENAEKVIRISDKCFKVKDLVTVIKEEFIRVFCHATTIVFSYDVVYRNYFAFPQLDNRAEEKVARWKKDSSISVTSLPPNVILLFLDSNSRHNFHRRLPLTLGVLRDLGAQELFGYTKAAYNTYPNSVCFLTGMFEEDMATMCRPFPEHALDDCPFIWKEFSKAGYLTGHAEDVPYAATYTRDKKPGFVKKPVDFYFRTLLLTWNKLRCKESRSQEWYYHRCVGGPQRSDEIILDYIMKILDFASGRAPVFFFNHENVFSHRCIHAMRFLDKPLSTFIKTVTKSHPNTILFVFGDHGDNIKPFSETLLGWYESRLPAMWIYLPPTIRSSHPDWSRALEINSRRLTSTFDLYHTLVHILATFNHTVALDQKQKTGQSLLVPVPENRTCSDANINTYCTCELPSLPVLKRLMLNLYV